MLTAQIPMSLIGPIKIIGQHLNEEIKVPLATFETPLWPSTHRGAKLSRLAGGIRATLINDKMVRSILFEAPNAERAVTVVNELEQNKALLQAQITTTSRFAQFLDMHYQIVGSLVFLRLAYQTGDASGHNMVTQASQHILEWILKHYPELEYVSLSGNYCTDKKVSAVNGILGRGKNVVCEMTLPRAICKRYLRATPEQIVDINLKKNLIGSTVAGGIRSANAHFANILLGFYLATGQDAANIVEGSQGIVYAAIKNDALYFSCTIPNLIVGTVGNGKHHGFVKDNLALLGCLDERQPGDNAKRLALIAGATVLCGELSLLAALTNQGELMKSHLLIERKGKQVFCDA